MLELPEAITIARQMNRELRGKRIETCVAGHAPHRYTSWNKSLEDYERTLPGRVFGEAREQG